MNPLLITGPRGCDLDPDEVKRSMGAVLRQGRKAKKWTQEDVADYLGVSSEFYARLERGHAFPSTINLKRLADLLRLPVDALLGLRPLERLDVLPDPEPARWRKLSRRLRRVPIKDIRMVHRLLDRLEQIQVERSPRQEPEEAQPCAE